jgi:hypothetical protein
MANVSQVCPAIHPDLAIAPEGTAGHSILFRDAAAGPRADEITLLGSATRITDHAVEITLAAGERARLDPLIARGERGPRGRPAVRIVDADRLLAWQLYWRGENFWSGDEIWGPLPEMRTAFVKTDNVEFNKYIADRTRAPVGRRYFLVTEAGRITSARSQLPERGKNTYEVIDTSSNKFSLSAFWL